MEDLPGILGQSAFGDAPCEGLYFRYDVGKWLEIRAKYVRPSFVQSIDKHWSNAPLQKNQIVY